ncbi:MAG: type II toxin-antitoxin system VapC family toxin [Gemmataceae bacterium]
MRRYLLDTGAAGDYLARRNQVFPRAKDEVARGNRIGICVPVLGELHYGIELSSSRERNLQRLHRDMPTLTVWPYNDSAAAEYGRLAAALRRLGRPMQQSDIQIAAIALSLGNCTVVSGDSDLADVPGLTVENWAK